MVTNSLLEIGCRLYCIYSFKDFTEHKAVETSIITSVYKLKTLIEQINWWPVSLYQIECGENLKKKA